MRFPASDQGPDLIETITVQSIQLVILSAIVGLGCVQLGCVPESGAVLSTEGQSHELRKEAADDGDTQLGEANPPTLRILLCGARSSQGSFSCAIFDNEEDFAQRQNSLVAKTLSVPEDITEVTTWEIRTLPPGRYAIGAFHDENKNGKLDRHLLGYPVEAYGFSNKARGRLGPPAFDQATFEFGSVDLEMTIELK